MRLDQSFTMKATTRPLFALVLVFVPLLLWLWLPVEKQRPAQAAGREAESMKSVVRPARPSERADQQASPAISAGESASREAQVRKEIASAVRAFAERVAAGMEQFPAKTQYDECIRTAGDCLSLQSDLIYYSVDTLLARAAKADEEPFGVRHWTASDDPNIRALAREVLGEIVANSADPNERVTALLLVRDGDPERPTGPKPLPEAAYRGIASRPAPETGLIAELHRTVPLPSDDAAREFVDLARSSDSRQRKAAFDALGHRATAARFHEALLAAAPSGRADWMRVALAAANCGLPCSQSIEHIMQTGGPEARVALYEALGMAPVREIDPLVRLALESSPAIEPDELAKRDALLADAFAN